MPYKDPETRKIKQREYSRTYRLRIAGSETEERIRQRKLAYMKSRWEHIKSTRPDVMEAIRRRAREYYKTPKGKSARRAYLDANKDKVSLLHERFLISHPNYDRDRNRKYWREKTDEMRRRGRVNSQNRRQRVRQRSGFIAKSVIQKLMERQNAMCVYCNANLLSTRFELDHVHPLSKGGEHSERNLQLLCMPCNRKKGSKDHNTFMQMSRRC